jgi:hypothetical protein
VVASTKSGQEQIEDRGTCPSVQGGGGATGFCGLAGVDTQTLNLFSLATETMDFSGLSLIKLKKQEMETQVGDPGCPQLPDSSLGMSSRTGATGSAEWASADCRCEC